MVPALGTALRASHDLWSRRSRRPSGLWQLASVVYFSVKGGHDPPALMPLCFSIKSGVRVFFARCSAVVNFGTVQLMRRAVRMSRCRQVKEPSRTTTKHRTFTSPACPKPKTRSPKPQSPKPEELKERLWPEISRYMGQENYDSV